jgi:hypothetical protein
MWRSQKKPGREDGLFLMTCRLMKFDPVAREHVAYKEAKIK